MKIKISKLILDTCACSRIAMSPHREAIEAHLDFNFRRMVSVVTFWELLGKIDGGENSTHFERDQKAFEVAAGRRLKMLPHPLSFGLKNVLNIHLSGPTSPEQFEKLYKLVLKAKSKKQLYDGQSIIPGSTRLVCFDPLSVREQQKEGEDSHIERLEQMMSKNPLFPSGSAWARMMVEENTKETTLDVQQAETLGERLNAAYQFEMQVWKATTASKSKYNPEKHRNDWGDMQQMMHLCDPTMHLMTADSPMRQKVSESHQANRVLYLPDYLQQNDLKL